MPFQRMLFMPAGACRVIFEIIFKPTICDQKIPIKRKTKNMNHRKIFYWSITGVLAGKPWVFAFLLLLQLLFVWQMMPETKVVSQEDLEKQLMMSNPTILDQNL